MPHYRTRRLAGLVYLGYFKGHEYSPRQCPRSCGGPHYFITLICFLFISVLGTGPRGGTGAKGESRAQSRGERARRGRLGRGGATEEVEERLALGGERARARGRQRARGHAVQPLCGSVKVHRMRCQSVAGTPRALNHPGAMKIKDK